MFLLTENALPNSDESLELIRLYMYCLNTCII